MVRATPAGPSVRTVPEGDDHERLVCPDCGFISYENPKVVVGSVCTWEERILLCRRAIDPRSGYWTLPAGYLELNETTEAGAAREAWEEARAEIEIDTLLAVYNIPRHQPDPADLPRAADVGRRRGRSRERGGRPVRLGRHPVGRPRFPLGALGADPFRRHAPARHLRAAHQPAGRARQLLASNCWARRSAPSGCARTRRPRRGAGRPRPRRRRWRGRAGRTFQQARRSRRPWRCRPAW